VGPASARRAKASTPAPTRSGAGRPSARLASAIRLISRSDPSRNTSANSAAFDGKWRYSEPVAIPARSATACTPADA
jgi:hypothetical protein